MGLEIWKVKYELHAKVEWEVRDFLEPYMNEDGKIYITDEDEKQRILEELKDDYERETSDKRKEYIQTAMNIIEEMETGAEYEVG